MPLSLGLSSLTYVVKRTGKLCQDMIDYSSNFSLKLPGQVRSEEEIIKYFEDHPEELMLLLKIVHDCANQEQGNERALNLTNRGDEESNVTGKLTEWSKIDQPSRNRYEEQTSPRSSDSIPETIRKHEKEINKPYQKSRVDNKTSRKVDKFWINLPILLIFVIYPFLVVSCKVANHYYDPLESEKFLYNRLNLIGKYQYQLAKPMTLINGLVNKYIYSTMDRYGNWLKDQGSLPYVDVIWKETWWSSKICLQYYHFKINLLGWSMLSSPISLAWDMIWTRGYRPYRSKTALREVLTKTVNNLRIEPNEDGYQVVQSLRHLPKKRLWLAIDKGAALMSDWVEALVNPSTYNFNNDVAQLNVVAFEETGKAYVQSNNVVTYPLVKEARRENWVPEDTYQMSDDYVLLPILRGKKETSLPRSTINLCASFCTTLVKNLFTWTSRNWEQAEVNVLYHGTQYLLSYTRPKFDDWVYNKVGQVGRSFTGWLKESKIDNFFTNFIKDSMVSSLESMLPKVPNDPVDQNYLFNDEEHSRMTNKLLQAWSYLKFTFQAAWYLGWSISAVSHTWWGILLGEKMNWFSNKDDEKSNVVDEELGIVQEKSNVVDEELGIVQEKSNVVDENSKLVTLQEWGVLKGKTVLMAIDYWSEWVFGYKMFVKESEDQLVMEKVTEENLGHLKVLTPQLLKICDNLFDWVILSKLDISHQLMSCLTEVGLSSHDVIQLYFNSFVLSELNLSLVKGKEVFLLKSFQAIYDRLNISSNCMTMNQYIEGLEKLEAGFNLLSNRSPEWTLTATESDTFLHQLILPSLANQEEIEILRLPHRLQKLREIQAFFMVETDSLQVVANQLSWVLPEGDYNYAIVPKYSDFKDDRLVKHNLRLELNHMLKYLFNMILNEENELSGIEEPKVIFGNYVRQRQENNDWLNFLNELSNETIMSRSLLRSSTGREQGMEVGRVGIDRLASILEEDKNIPELFDGEDLNVESSEEIKVQASTNNARRILNASAIQLQEQVLDGAEQVSNEAEQKFIKGIKKVPVLGAVVRYHEQFTTTRKVTRLATKKIIHHPKEAGKQATESFLSRITSSLDPSGLDMEFNADSENDKVAEEIVSNPDSFEEAEPVMQATEFDPIDHQSLSRDRAFNQSHTPNLAGRFSSREINVGKENKIHQKKLLLNELIGKGIQSLEEKVGSQRNTGSWNKLLESLGKIRRIYSSLNTDDVRLGSYDDRIWEYDQKFSEYLKILKEVKKNSPVTYKEVIGELNTLLTDVSRESENFDESSHRMREQTVMLGSFDPTNHRVFIARRWLDELKSKDVLKLTERRSIISGIKPLIPRITTQTSLPNTFLGRLINLNFNTSEDDDAKRDTLDEDGFDEDGKEFDMVDNDSKRSSMLDSERKAAESELISRHMQRKLREKVEEIRTTIMSDHRLDIFTNVLYDLYHARELQEVELLDVDVRIFDPNLKFNLGNKDIHFQIENFRSMLILLIHYLQESNNISGLNMVLSIFFSDAYMIDSSEEVQSFDPGRHVRKHDLAYDRLSYLGNELRKFISENGGTYQLFEDSKNNRNLFKNFLIAKLGLEEFNKIYDSRLSKLNLNFEYNFFRKNWLQHQRWLKEPTMNLVPKINFINKGETPKFINMFIDRTIREESQNMSRRIEEKAERMLQVSRASTPRELPSLRPGLSMAVQHHPSNTPSQTMRTVDEVNTPRANTPSQTMRTVDEVNTPSQTMKTVDEVNTPRANTPSQTMRTVDETSGTNFNALFEDIQFNNQRRTHRQRIEFSIMGDLLDEVNFKQTELGIQSDNPEQAEEQLLVVNSEEIPDLNDIVVPSSHDIALSLSDDHDLDVAVI